MWRDDREIIITPSFGPRIDFPLTPRRKFGFNEREKKDLVIAVGVLTIAFAFALSGGIAKIGKNFPITLIASFGAVITGFLLHELGHKFVAQKFGFWAEFNYWNLGLMLALLTGLMGWLIAAPGAVYIAGYPTKEENGKISAAGPSMNILIGITILPFIFIASGTIKHIISIIAVINFVLAGFNLIPIYPFDGSKILRWNLVIYILIWIPILFVFILYLSGLF